MTLSLETKVMCSLYAHSYSCADEAELQDAVERAFVASNFRYEREVYLSPRDRVDFMVEHVAVELKVKTDAKSLLAQVLRYASHERVGAVVVGSTDHRALSLDTKSVNGKPLHIVLLRRF